ncbi:MAG: hypothetical protein V2J02_21330 [Pseudomonadales bacterium]|nr:hypothetical protein [Pseudomonadales bacterium]
MTHVIELNDAGVTLATEAGILAESPGFAVVDARRVAVGEQAMREARLNPRHTVSQFWQRLSTDPLQTPNARARTQADLAHAHLLHLWETVGREGEEVIFAIPGHYGREQLALLLGIARACPFRAVGLVDAAVAAAATEATPDGTVLHLDAQLHQTVITRLRADDGIVRERVDDLPVVGLAALRDAWVNLVADAFIRETRFDPLHVAATEQNLYDRLDDWLAALATAAEVPVELDTGSHVYRVTLARERLVEKVAARYRTLLDRLLQERGPDGETVVLVGERLARLPGLLDALRSTPGLAPRVLARDAALRGALAHEGRIRGDGDALAFVTRLPRAASAPAPRQAQAPAQATAPAPEAPPAPRPVPAPRAGRGPTHVLLGGTAHALPEQEAVLGGPGGLGSDLLPEPVATLGRTEAGWLLTPHAARSVRADGAPLEDPTPMVPGQRLTVGEDRVRLELIRVLEAG